jgi:AcrR family transcriptional regulator
MMSGMASPERLTPERRRALTRRALLDAAATEFGAKGFHGASLDAIAKAAGFTKGAVYSNFDNKADLFLALMDDRLEREESFITSAMYEDVGPMEGQIDRALATHAELRRDETLRALFFEFVVYSLRHPEVRERLIDFTRRQLAQVEAMAARGAAAFGATPRYPMEFVGFVMWALNQGIELYRVIEPEGMTAEREAAMVAFQSDLLRIAPEPGAADSGA